MSVKHSFCKNKKYSKSTPKERNVQWNVESDRQQQRKANDKINVVYERLRKYLTDDEIHQLRECPTIQEAWDYFLTIKENLYSRSSQHYMNYTEWRAKQCESNHKQAE